MKNWYYTVGMLLLYLAVFRVWQSFPSRSMFLVGALVTIGLMTTGMIWAEGHGYFANRRDLFLHALVIVDVGLEGGAYEVVRAVSLRLLGADGDVARFHNSHNFYWCALAFGFLVGGYHYSAIRTRDRIGNEPNAGEVALG